MKEHVEKVFPRKIAVAVIDMLHNKIQVETPQIVAISILIYPSFPRKLIKFKKTFKNHRLEMTDFSRQRLNTCTNTVLISI